MWLRNEVGNTSKKLSIVGTVLSIDDTQQVEATSVGNDDNMREQHKGQ